MMRKLLTLLSLFFAACVSGFAFYHAFDMKIEEGYSIRFSSKNPTGVFTSLKGDIRFNEHDLANSRFDVTVDVASINTGNKLKNKHARSKKWFDAETYPTIRFTSSEIARTDSGFVTTGILDMHGVQKQISIPFIFRDNTFTGSFMVNRLDYNIGTTRGLSKKAATELKVDISVPVSQQ